MCGGLNAATPPRANLNPVATTRCAWAQRYLTRTLSPETRTQTAPPSTRQRFVELNVYATRQDTHHRGAWVPAVVSTGVFLTHVQWPVYGPHITDSHVVLAPMYA